MWTYYAVLSFHKGQYQGLLTVFKPGMPSLRMIMNCANQFEQDVICELCKITLPDPLDSVELYKDYLCTATYDFINETVIQHYIEMRGNPKPCELIIAGRDCELSLNKKESNHVE